MKKICLIVLVLVAVSLSANAQLLNKKNGLDQITVSALKAQTGFLSSDWTEGRDTGSEGEYMAGDYIASMLELYGVEPGGDPIYSRDARTGRSGAQRSYFQNFSLMTTIAGENSMSVTTSREGVTRTLFLEENVDYVSNPSYPGGSITAPVIFVGYGYRNDESAYNDFKGLDIKGKIILRLAGVPSTDGQETSAYAGYRASMTKDASALELGAVGIIEVNPANTDGSIWAETPDFLVKSPAERGGRRTRTRLSIPEEDSKEYFPKVTLTLKAAKSIMAGSGIDISAFSGGSVQKASRDFNTTLTISSSVTTKFIKVRNIIGYIEGKNTDEAIVIGAHYDHVGMRDGSIYNGADDNASGTVGVMTIARAIKATGIKPEKTIVFALWTGEEKGLLGSRYFVENPTLPLENIKLHLNFDMISRYVSDDEPNKALISYTPNAPNMQLLSEKHIKEFNIALEPDYLETESIPGGSDHASFTARKIPTTRIKPGHREEYHTPADEVSTLDWDIFQKVVQISFLNMWELANTEW